MRQRNKPIFFVFGICFNGSCIKNPHTYKLHELLFWNCDTKNCDFMKYLRQKNLLGGIDQTEISNLLRCHISGLNKDLLHLFINH